MLANGCQRQSLKRPLQLDISAFAFGGGICLFTCFFVGKFFVFQIRPLRAETRRDFGKFSIDIAAKTAGLRIETDRYRLPAQAAQYRRAIR